MLLQITYSAVDSNKKPNIVKVGAVTSFLLTGLHRDTRYSVRVTSYGDKLFLDSTAASATVKTDFDGKLLTFSRLNMSGRMVLLRLAHNSLTTLEPFSFNGGIVQLYITNGTI